MFATSVATKRHNPTNEVNIPLARVAILSIIHHVKSKTSNVDIAIMEHRVQGPTRLNAIDKMIKHSISKQDSSCPNVL